MTLPMKGHHKVDVLPYLLTSNVIGMNFRILNCLNWEVFDNPKILFNGRRLKENPLLKRCALATDENWLRLCN